MTRKLVSRHFESTTFSSSKSFIAGRWQIIEVLGPVTYRVQLESGRYRKCHQDHLRERVVTDGGPEMSQWMRVALLPQMTLLGKRQVPSLRLHLLILVRRCHRHHSSRTILDFDRIISAGSSRTCYYKIPSTSEAYLVS